MSDFPLPRIKDFLQSVVPFDAMEESELQRLVGLMDLAYFPRGEVIIQTGAEPSKNLYVIMNGSVRVTLPRQSGEELLIDVRGEGDTFGALSLLQGEQALFTVTAQEDLLAFMLPDEPFRALVRDNQVFKRHFSFSLARNIDAVRRAADRHTTQMTGTGSLGLDAVLTGSRVHELMSKKLLTCLEATPVKAAAILMTQRKVGSIMVCESGGRPLGILTDTDLRVRVLAAGAAPDTPVAEVMSQSVKAISPQAFAFEAMIEMARHGVHHLAVTEGQRLVGVISDHDLTMVTGSSPVGVMKEVAKVSSLEHLAGLPRRMNRVMETLLRLGGSAEYMLDVLSEFNDRLTLRLLRLTQQAMEHEGLGPPPVQFSWLALGSAGRREQALNQGQDYAVVYANVPPDHEEAVHGWFSEFARRVSEGLSSCGFVGDPDAVMSDSRRCCRSESSWEESFMAWISAAEPPVLAQAAKYFDLRAVYAETGFVETLWNKILGAIERDRGFLGRLRRAGSQRRPPVGFLRQFAVEPDGSYLDRLNLKEVALDPVAWAARLMALDQKVRQTNTLERLGAVARLGLLKDRTAEDLYEAYSFITLLRIARRLEENHNGHDSGAYLDPASLNRVQRKMLKESFQVIGQLQEFTAQRYPD
ncbi:MAG: CBS domain-containing protein [Proteobacteria bacterium]|nr:CBS domain-containing protein [Pseudomonadota bacterium]MBU2516164.1 CBS domain-containing protein [Pseudomonadota bacterium]